MSSAALSISLITHTSTTSVPDHSTPSNQTSFRFMPSSSGPSLTLVAATGRTTRSDGMGGTQLAFVCSPVTTGFEGAEQLTQAAIEAEGAIKARKAIMQNLRDVTLRYLGNLDSAQALWRPLHQPKESQDWARVVDLVSGYHGMSNTTRALAENERTDAQIFPQIRIMASDWVSSIERTPEGDLDPAWQSALGSIDKPLTEDERQDILDRLVRKPSSYFNSEIWVAEEVHVLQTRA